MEGTPWAGVNWAILYGFGLIVAAFALAAIYGMLCHDPAQARKATPIDDLRTLLAGHYCFFTICLGHAGVELLFGTSWAIGRPGTSRRTDRFRGLSTDCLRRRLPVSSILLGSVG